MTGASLLCLATIAFLVPRDLLLPETRDVEVWFGFELRGVAAIASAPLHWAIFATGAWAFWRARPWIVPAAAAYTFLIAVSHLVWSGLSPQGDGWLYGQLYLAVFSIPGFAILALARRWPATTGRS